MGCEQRQVGQRALGTFDTRPVPEPNGQRVCSFSFEACFQFSRTTQSASLRNGTDNRLQLEYRIEAETFTGKKYYRVRFNASADSDTPNVVTRELELQWWTLGREHCSRELVYLKVRAGTGPPCESRRTAFQ